MLKALALALAQLPERDLRGPLIDTLLWTFCALLLLGFSAFRLLGDLTRSWAESGLLALLGSVILTSGAVWLLFVVIENLILFCYANRIAGAVERKYYPDLPSAKGMGWSDALTSGIALMVWTMIGNLLCIPCYLFLPGANLVLFLLLNGYFLGRGYFDAVALRRMNRVASIKLWPEHRMAFAIVGISSMICLTVPLLNLFVPLIGLAVSVHLIQRHALETAMYKIKGNL